MKTTKISQIDLHMPSTVEEFAVFISQTYSHLQWDPYIDLKIKQDFAQFQAAHPTIDLRDYFDLQSLESGAIPRLKGKAIIVDLDGTLCNVDHRRYLVEGKNKDFELFAKLCTKDTPNKWCLDIIKAMMFTHHIIFVSGRKYRHELDTTEWLYDNVPGSLRFSLMMRGDDDDRSDEIVKKEIYENFIKPYYNVSFCIDDRTRVVNMWRSIGLTCLQCAPGDF